MPRIRTIKPEFPQSETIGSLSRDARLLFIQLWTIVDDLGRARAASRMLASLLYPYDDDARKLIGQWLDELETKLCIRRYEVDGSQYLEVINWLKHQKIDHPSKSRLPEFREGSRILAPDLGPRTKDQREREKKPAIQEWKPNEKHHELAAKLGVLVSEVEETFRDYVANHPRKYRDYDAAFRTFLKRHKQFSGANNAKTGGTIIDAADRLLERVKSFDARPADLCDRAGAPPVRLLPKG